MGVSCNVIVSKPKDSCNMKFIKSNKLLTSSIVSLCLLTGHLSATNHTLVSLIIAILFVALVFMGTDSLSGLTYNVPYLYDNNGCISTITTYAACYTLL